MGGEHLVSQGGHGGDTTGPSEGLGCLGVGKPVTVSRAAAEPPWHSRKVNLWARAEQPSELVVVAWQVDMFESPTGVRHQLVLQVGWMVHVNGSRTLRKSSFAMFDGEVDRCAGNTPKRY